MSGIVTLVQQAIIDRLVADCTTPYPEEDVARLAGAVRNALQSDPTRGIWAEVYHEYPGSTDWSDEMDEKMSEVGGGWFWFRRYTIMMRAFHTRGGLDKDTASDHFGETNRRVLKSMMRPWTEIIDDSGESLVYLKGVLNQTDPGGGPRHSWIYSITFKLEFVTYLPYQV